MLGGETIFICCCFCCLLCFSWAFSLLELLLTLLPSSLLLFLLLLPVLMMDLLLLLLLALLMRRDCMFSDVCHPNTFCDRRSGLDNDVVIVGPGDDCNECRLFCYKCCCCNCRDGFCHPNTFSLWSKLLFLALTPLQPLNSTSKKGKNRALRVSTAIIRSPCRRRDGRRSSINALPCSCKSLLLLARGVFMLVLAATIMLPLSCDWCLMCMRILPFFSWNFGFHFNLIRQPTIITFLF